MRQYELTYIIRPDLDEEAVAAVAQRVEQIIRDNGGRVLKVEPWGKRPLAYSIQHYNEGHYILLLTELNDVVIREIERHMKLSEDIIRHLLVRVEPVEVAEEAGAAEAEPPETAESEQAEPPETAEPAQPAEQAEPPETAESAEPEETA